MRAAVLLVLIGTAGANIFLHSPRGSNNKLNEVSNSVQNPLRLFDSQNSPRGGYQVGDKCAPSCSDSNGIYDKTTPGAGQGQMYYYVDSHLRIEWTNQHGCGHANENIRCEIVLQYMCEDSAPELRDGSTTDTVPNTVIGASDQQYGLQESRQDYQNCESRERNKGLYTADQRLAGDAATSTRQNPAGARSGFECPEERDYYPYWHPTPWRDIAILTDETGRCHYYESHSQNVRDLGMCCDAAHFDATDGDCKQLQVNGGPGPNNRIACQRINAGRWVEKGKWGSSPPACFVAPFGRDNHFGNTDYPPDYTRALDLEIREPFFDWLIPNNVFETLSSDEATCVLRIRYNISSADFQGWRGFDEESHDPEAVDSLYNAEDAKMGGTDPEADFIGFSNTGATTTSFPLKLNVDTAHIGRTFEDRSHSFKIKRRPSSGPCSNRRIFNLNVKGRRGNIAEVFPAVPYDFTPVKLEVGEGDCIHFQWTGSDANPEDNEGHGRRMTDRSNIVELHSRGENVPVRHGYAEVADGSTWWPSWGSMFPDEATVRKMAYLDQEISSACDDAESDQDASSNCKYLNAAPAYFDGGLVPMINPGWYAFMSTRNNDFSTQSQKAIIMVSHFTIFLIIFGAIAVAVLIILCLTFARYKIVTQPDRGIAQSPFGGIILWSSNWVIACVKRTWCWHHPFTTLLLITCMGLYGVGYMQALDDGEAAPSYRFAKGFGRCLDILCNLIFMPVLRNLASWLRTTPMAQVLPLDDNLYFHKTVGVLIALAACGHIFNHYLKFFWHQRVGSGLSVTQQAVMRYTGMSGHLLVLLMTFMFITALERFRRQHWKIWCTKYTFSGHSLFVRVHKLWIVVLILLWTHSQSFWHYSIFPVCLLIIDKLIGRLRGQKQVELVSAQMPTRDVLYLTMQPTDGRRFKFQSGQYLFLMCPEVSKVEWHPFTISSSPWERTFSVHIRSRSDMDWTHALRKVLLPEGGVKQKAMPARASLEEKYQRSQGAAMRQLPKGAAGNVPADTAIQVGGHHLYVDGPYGTASEEVFHFSVLILVAAGMGVTPFASILKTLAYQAKNDMLETPLKKVSFYWTCRDQAEFNSFKDIMEGICTDPYLGRMFDLNTYLTGELNLKSISASEKYHQFAGRPNWSRIGKKIGDEYPDDDVGVFLCGPAAIGTQLAAMCKTMNPVAVDTRSSVADRRTSRLDVHKRPRKFVFHRENF